MIPTTAPHEEPDLSPVISGEIWKENKPLLIRWTSDWDCGYDTGWWYVIREGSYDLAELSASSRRNIRKALRNCRVEKIDPVQYIDDLWRVFNEAIIRYENYDIPFDKDGFIKEWIKGRGEFWAGFDNTGLMIGFAIFYVHDDWVDFAYAKYSAKYLKLRVSDAINSRTLEYYLNELGKKYVSNGQRSILHITNVQTYLMEHFGYRKAYCNLHFRCRRALGALIKIMYPMRRVLRKLERVNGVHLLNSLLIMEEIVESVDHKEHYHKDTGNIDET